MNKKLLEFLLIGVFCMAGISNGEQTNIIASQPTHYFYLPMARVNPANNLVLSFHEISYGLTGNLQVQASIFDNIGRIDFGAKYGIQDNLSVGAGIAHTLVHIPNYRSHGIGQDESRLGLFLCYEFLQRSTPEAVVSPHAQLFGESNSIGCDLGGMITPTNLWSFIWEVGTSCDLNSGLFYFDTDGGLRIHPPSIPFLNFDCGVDVQDFALNVDHPSTSVTIFFDVIFAMVAK
ncbi:MAG TPA: hypothetical protein DCO75_09290 [Fibrobacteres bacterium]|nr:hypothetical protein [Fibrobacterota bacterium]